MGTDKRVQILLSTYNGETYLRAQLESFLDLENINSCRILIRDDGSTDGTRNILEEYRTKSNFQIVCGKNWGTTKSYEWLIRNSDPSCDYFAFSDQDDVWLPQKLSIAIEALEQLSGQTPALFGSRTCVTDQALHPIGVSVPLKRGTSFYNAMVQNVLPGHTQVFNRALWTLLAERGLYGAHVVDWWVYLAASGLGKVVFSNAVTVLHRQHDSNSIGYRVGALRGLQKKLIYLIQGKGNSISLQLSAFLKCYGDILPAAYQDEVRAYLEGLTTISARLKYLRHSQVFRQESGEDVAFRLLYLLGKYNLQWQ